MSKGGRELTTKLNHIKKGEREINNHIKERPQMLGIQRGEKSHVFRGERHVHVVCVSALL